MRSDRDVQEVIDSFSPRTVGDEAACFARRVVAAARPLNGQRAKALLFACSKLGEFGLSCGLPPSPAVLFHPSVIERFVLCGASEMSNATRRTMRTNLRHVAVRVLPLPPAGSLLSREAAKAPYLREEIAAYLALSDTQPSISRRHRANGLICLGAGAGLMGSDLRHLRGSDVTSCHGGLVASVAGRHPRRVPVLARYHDRLQASARFAGEGYVIGGRDPRRHNVTSQLTASLAGGLGLPRPDTGRLRATWLSEVAQLLGLKAFLQAAGVSCTQRLGDLVSHLEAVDEEQSVLLLGGRS